MTWESFPMGKRALRPESIRPFVYRVEILVAEPRSMSCQTAFTV